MANGEDISPFDQRIVYVSKCLLDESTGSFTFDEGKRQIGIILKELKTVDDYTTEAVGDGLSRILIIPNICAAFSGKPLEEQSTINITYLAEYLAMFGFAELFLKITRDLEHNITQEVFNNDSQIGFNFYVLCTIFSNFSDKCPQLGEDFCKHGSVDVIMRLAKVLDTDTNDESFKESIKIFNLLSSTLHNCIRHNSANTHLYRKADVVDFFESKTSSKHLNIRIGSVLILSQVADEKVTERVAPNLDCVLLLMELLRRAVRNQSHTIEVTGDLDGAARYSAQELVNALARLAVNDDNKVAIEACGGIPVLMSMLQSTFSDEDSLEAFTLLWHLVFADSVRREAFVQVEIIEIFELLMNSKSYFMREISKYILWEIRDNEMNFPPESPTMRSVFERPPYYLAMPVDDDVCKSRCIMISFQSEAQPKALYIRDRLVDRGYVVWMNEHPLRARILEKKIAVIREAVAVLLCVSERYKESPSCRSEASYADKLGKPLIPLLMDSEYQPDGWLSKLLGTSSIRHRFCTDDDMDSHLPGLMIELGDRGKASPVRVLGTRLKSAIKKIRTTIGNNDEDSSDDDGFQTISRSNPRYWTSQRLRTWLKENNLQSVRLPPDLFQGNQLLQMYGHYKMDAVKLSNAVKSDFKLEDNMVQKFTTAMCQLFG